MNGLGGARQLIDLACFCQEARQPVMWVTSAARAFASWNALQAGTPACYFPVSLLVKRR